MKLRGAGGNEFELRLVGYQFLELDLIGDALPDYDSNWLLIEVAGTVEGRSWQAINPCLLTYEVALLIAWLEAVAAGDTPKPSIYFTEPCLEFEVQDYASSERQRLRVYFQRGCSPGWAPVGWWDHWAEFSTSENDLGQWARDLRDQLRRFPPRRGVERKDPYRRWFGAAGYGSGG